MIPSDTENLQDPSPGMHQILFSVEMSRAFIQEVTHTNTHTPGLYTYTCTGLHTEIHARGGGSNYKQVGSFVVAIYCFFSESGGGKSVLGGKGHPPPPLNAPIVHCTSILVGLYY